MIRIYRAAVLLAAVLTTISVFNGAWADMGQAVDLPATAGSWTRSHVQELIDEQNIFDYMDGAGELYLSYRFDRLEVYEYTNPDQSRILVEVYVLDSPQDAFGLLSLDWGGRPVDIAPGSTISGERTTAPKHRFLYGAGLLRMAVDSLYVRILCQQETPASKKAVFSIGRSISNHRSPSPEPDILKELPLKLSNYRLLRDRIAYFRSYLVLNMFYYLSHQNILNLGHEAEAVFAPYDLPGGEGAHRIQLLFIRYPDPEQASSALSVFHRVYLPEYPEGGKNSSGAVSRHMRIEDGFVAYKLDGTDLVILFELPDSRTAEIILNRLAQE